MMLSVEREIQNHLIASKNQKPLNSITKYIMREKTIIFTNTIDATTDLVLSHFPNATNDVFRLNFDLFDEYQFKLTASAFEISDPTGRVLNSNDVKKFYYRKPSREDKSEPLKDYAQEEKWAFLREVVNQFWAQNKIVLVEPHADIQRLGKLTQLKLAKEHFSIPDTVFSNRPSQIDVDWKQAIVKSITGKSINGKNVFTSIVEPNHLSPDYLWLLQEYITAAFDVTVVYIRGRLFSFRLKRDFLKESVDFRFPTAQNLWDRWEYITLATEIETHITKFMQRAKLHYGRLDFLETENGELVFCEINPNGQFAWLDLRNHHGLISAIVDEISPHTPLHPIPFSPFI